MKEKNNNSNLLVVHINAKGKYNMEHTASPRLAYIVPSNLIPPFSRPVPQLFLHRQIFRTGLHRTQRNEIYDALTIL